MIKYSYNTLVYASEDIEEGISRLSRFGYDGVELVGEPKEMNLRRVKELLSKWDIQASSLCAIYTQERDLASSNEEIRKNAVAYLKDLVNMASFLEAPGFSVTPTACMKIRPEGDKAQEWAWAVEGIREAGKYALEHGIRFAVEPWNRYENYLLNTLEQSLSMVKEIDLPNVGCMGDTFHMNLEERDIADAFRSVEGHLFYVHIADSNRAAPGTGHTDFASVAAALKDINYSGYLSMELLPAAADPFLVLKGSRCDEFYDEYTKESIEFLKQLFD